MTRCEAPVVLTFCFETFAKERPCSLQFEASYDFERTLFYGAKAFVFIGYQARPKVRVGVGGPFPDFSVEFFILTRVSFTTLTHAPDGWCAS